jgi:hypothetical protein
MSKLTNPALIAFPAQRTRDPAVARRARLRQYAKAKKAFLQSNPVCDVCDIRRSVTVHHRRGRANDLLLLQSEWVSCCAECHSFIHSHPTWAKAEGWLRGPWNHAPKP